MFPNINIAENLNSYFNPFFQNETDKQLPFIAEEIFNNFHSIFTAIRNLPDYSINKLDKWDHQLEEFIPNFSFQTRIDGWVVELEDQFAPLTTFNDWLNSNGHGTWYRQVAECLVKLPFRAARNIIQQLYLLIKGIIYGTVHPLKALNHAAKLLVMTSCEMTKPETWANMGAGMIGSSLGFALATGGGTRSFWISNGWSDDYRWRIYKYFKRYFAR